MTEPVQPPMTDDDRVARVRERAYALWEADGSPSGGAEAYWYRAEREIDAEDGASSPASDLDAGADPLADKPGV